MHACVCVRVCVENENNSDKRNANVPTHHCVDAGSLVRWLPVWILRTVREGVEDNILCGLKNYAYPNPRGLEIQGFTNTTFSLQQDFFNLRHLQDKLN